jgi:L-seryl-tRNA(Ser) seleniumtransferase
MNPAALNRYRQLPPVHEVLAAPALAEWRQRVAAEHITEAVRAALASLRGQITAGPVNEATLSPQNVACLAAEWLAQTHAESLRPVINATGILLHTNLGRAPLAPAAAAAVHMIATGYCNLEIDLTTGQRASRQAHVQRLLTRLFSCEAATVVNNNAAATVLALRALACGREVIISRGELVEIGGSFRIPEIMAASGAKLREVGTTNITHTRDYAAAITDQTAALLRVHTSNFKMVGHTLAPPLEELVDLAHARGLLMIDDLGSGAMLDPSQWGLRDEPLPRSSLATGSDLVLFSGDKLLGGPQAGILAGRAAVVSRLEQDPLMRAFRLDKMTLAALEATLRAYLSPDQARQDLPLLKMLEAPVAMLRQRADAWAAQLHRAGKLHASTRADVSVVGGGSVPGQTLPTVVVVLQPLAMKAEELARRLRTGQPSVVPRIDADGVLLDPRTVFADQDSALLTAVRAATSLETA